jgi:hypothetical protein
MPFLTSNGQRWTLFGDLLPWLSPDDRIFVLGKVIEWHNPYAEHPRGHTLSGFLISGAEALSQTPQLIEAALNGSRTVLDPTERSLALAALGRWLETGSRQKVLREAVAIAEEETEVSRYVLALVAVASAQEAAGDHGASIEMMRRALNAMDEIPLLLDFESTFSEVLPKLPEALKREALFALATRATPPSRGQLLCWLPSF